MLYSVTDKVSSITAPVGLVELQPDWRSLRICGYAPGNAEVMCFAYDTWNTDDPFHLCPRRKLADFLIKCETSHGRKFLVGFEIEFVLLDATGNPIQTVDNINGWSTTGGLRGNILSLMQATIAALQASSIDVLQLHTVEPNQLQIATRHSNPMDAIDSLMYSHECIKHMAVQYGLRATMTPKALKSDLCTGAHAHISIHPPDKHDNFLAGILENLQELCAFGLPSYDSYSRVTGLTNGSGTWVSWGTENRYVPVRGIEKARWELRFLDATANFYLALLMTFAAGMRGVQEGLLLGQKDCQQNPWFLGDEERKDLGIEKRLPTSLKESIEVLQESMTLDPILGKSMKQHYIAIKELDEREMSAWSDDLRRECFINMF